MNAHRLIALGFALLAAAAPLRSQGGSTGLTFLTLGVGSRGLGMGDAYVSAANDPAAMQYNPATLGSIDATAVTFMHRAWIQGTNAEFLALASNLGGVSVGFSVYSVSTGDIEVRNAPGPATETFTARNAALGVSLAYSLSPGLSIGVTAKYLYEKILIDEAGGTAFDIGGVYTLPAGLSIGAAVSNLGSVSELGTESSKLPTLLRGGVSYSASLTGAPVRFTGSLDLLTPLGDGTSHVHFGGEGLLYGSVGVRAGYQTGYEARGFTAGTGIRQGIVAVDYAFMPTKYDLGSTHAITLTLHLR